jgi:hypothetical protein
MYRFQLAGKITAIIVMNIAHFNILYFCRTDRTPDRDSPAFIQTYTLHIHTSHCWWRKELHPAPPYVWRWKGVHTALHVYTAGGGRKCIHPALLAVKRNTLWFCTVHTPCERVWWWKWYTLHIHRWLLLVYSCCMMLKITGKCQNAG